MLPDDRVDVDIEMDHEAIDSCPDSLVDFDFPRIVRITPQGSCCTEFSALDPDGSLAAQLQ
jgi:hypothetical protein